MDWLVGRFFDNFFTNVLTGNFAEAVANDVTYFAQNPGFAHTTAHIENLFLRVGNLVGGEQSILDLVNLCGG